MKLRPRTLVGRMALVQSLVALGALAALLALMFVTTAEITRQRENQYVRGFMYTAMEAMAGVRKTNATPSDEEILRTVAVNLRPHVRLDFFNHRGLHVGGVGAGAALPPVTTGTCAHVADNTGGRRACGIDADGYLIVAGFPLASDSDVRRFFSLLALVAALVAGGIFLTSRAVAARGLKPLVRIADRIDAIGPGTGQRVGPVKNAEELNRLSQKFDGLLDRVDQAFARERRFAAEASHELRTPLGVIRAELEVLACGGSAPEAARALASVDDLIGLVESLLLLSRAKAPFDRTSLMPVNLADLARDAVRDLLAARFAGRTIRLDAPDELLVAADERLLSRAITNLVENALKYSPAPAAVEVSVATEGDRAVLTVIDQGPGISADSVDRIFEPFFRDGAIRADLPGHGLGLPFVLAVAEAHGGEAVMVSSSGSGSRFAMRLPTSDHL